MTEETIDKDRTKTLMFDENNGLPKHWEVKKLGEVGQIISGGTPSTSEESYWNGNIAWISPSDLSGYTDKYISKGKKSITESGLKNSSARLISKGSVLFSSRAPIGYTVIAANDVCTNQGFKSVIPNKILSSDYLYHYLKSSKQMAEKVANGTTFKEISLKAFSQLSIPLPPLSEQKAIVSKIEELFSELDNGINQLKTAQQQLKVYRQSLLKWAFEGGITNKELRITNSSNQENQNHNKAELPKGWKVVTIGDTFEVYIGSTPKRNIPQYWGGNINWLSSGEIAFCNISHTRERITEEGLKNSSCKVHPKGTVIIAMIGEGKTRGQAAILKIPSAHNQNTAAIRVDEKVYSSILLYYYLVFKYEENRKVGSGNNQKALNKDRVKSITIPLPPLSEQQIIVSELESKLTVCDKIEETISQSLQQAESLRQSILKKAFQGKLI